MHTYSQKLIFYLDHMPQCLLFCCFFLFLFCFLQLTNFLFHFYFFLGETEIKDTDTDNTTAKTNNQTLYFAYN